MLKIIISFLIIINSILLGNSDLIPAMEIEKIRMMYYESVEKEDSISVFENYIAENYSTDHTQNPLIIQAYQGAIIAVKAKHAFWPFTKMSHLSDSMEILNYVIKNSPGNLEFRFIRFSILHYVPGILGYSEERDEDLNTIYELLINENYVGIPDHLIDGITQFLIDSGRLTNLQEIELTKQNILANSNE